MEELYTKEQVPELRGLIFYVLRRWRTLMLWAMIGLAIGLGWSALYQRANQPDRLQEKVHTWGKDDINIENIKKYADAEKIYQYKLNYRDNAYVMQLDASRAATVSVRTGVYAMLQDMDATAGALTDLMKNNRNLERLAAIIDPDCDGNSITDMVQINVFTEALEHAMIDTACTVSGSLEIKAIAPSEDIAKKLGDEIVAILSEDTASIAADSDLRLGTPIVSVYSGYVSEVLDIQNDIAASLRTLQETAEKAKKSLSDKELTYYKYVLSGKKLEEMAPCGFSKKYPVICCALMGVLAAVYFGVCYIFDAHIKQDSEIGGFYGVDLLASLEDPYGRTGMIDRLLKRLEDKSETDANSTEYLLTVLRQAGDRLLVSGDPEDPAVHDVLETLTDLAAAQISGPLYGDAAARTLLPSSDQVVLVIHYWKTTRRQMVRNLEIIAQSGKKLYGVVAIR